MRQKRPGPRNGHRVGLLRGSPRWGGARAGEAGAISRSGFGCSGDAQPPAARASRVRSLRRQRHGGSMLTTRGGTRASAGDRLLTMPSSRLIQLDPSRGVALAPPLLHGCRPGCRRVRPRSPLRAGDPQVSVVPEGGWPTRARSTGCRAGAEQVPKSRSRFRWQPGDERPHRSGPVANRVPALAAPRRRRPTRRWTPRRRDAHLREVGGPSSAAQCARGILGEPAQTTGATYLSALMTSVTPAGGGEMLTA